MENSVKQIRFSSRKKPLFAFEAEIVSYEPDESDGSITLHAEGRVLMQEDVAIQEMFASDYPGLLTVTEGDEEMLHSACMMMFLELDEGSFTARIVLGK